MRVAMGECEQHIGFGNPANQFAFRRVIDHGQAFAIQNSKFLQCFRERRIFGNPREIRLPQITGRE